MRNYTWWFWPSVLISIPFWIYLGILAACGKLKPLPESHRIRDAIRKERHAARHPADAGKE